MPENFKSDKKIIPNWRPETKLINQPLFKKLKEKKKEKEKWKTLVHDKIIQTTIIFVTLIKTIHAKTPPHTWKIAMLKPQIHVTQRIRVHVYPLTLSQSPFS